MTFETVLFLLGGDKHGMSFRNIQGKLVALQLSIQLFEVAINSLIQPSQMVRQVAQTGVINIHGHGRILDSLWVFFLFFCRGIRNSSNFSAERRNSPPLPDADLLENDKRNAEFS